MSANLGYQSGTVDLYQIVSEEGPVTKADLALYSDLSHPTVLKYLRELTAVGLVTSGPPIPSGPSGGRKAKSYVVTPNGKVALGIDITDTRFRVAAVNLSGEVIASRRIEIPFQRNAEYFEYVARQANLTFADAELPNGTLLGAGISMPGLVDPRSGLVGHGLVIDNFNLDIGQLEPYFDYPVWLVHDSVAAAMAEFERHKDLEQGLYIGLSRSVGGTLLVNGQLYSGEAGYSGELGHIRIHDDGLLCYCGRYGCADPYLNSSVLTAAPYMRLSEFFAAVDQGVPSATLRLDSYLQELALVVHDVRTLLGSPVILGGDVGPYLGPHLPRLNQMVDALTFNEADLAQDYLSVAVRLTQPAAAGAALFLLEEYKRTLSLPEPQTYSSRYLDPTVAIRDTPRSPREIALARRETSLRY